ncbi:hypothetical protein DDZ18_05055 [Marinicauda salina]|uniref:Sulfotransferase domain-containing protein n=1 Tax=Marinicauda salina TaxID=2135793 RepID=A0A2U2BVA1_9PROT|nr:hypothetical protein [Marinicauda salina]PWE17945.1 hypothetical protein DDZ18_05055 [Marinicauda salina]
MNGGSGGERDDYVRFLIVFHPRCGSSWLRSMLAANANLEAGAELLADKQSADRQRAFMDAFYTKPRKNGIEAVGFKAGPHQIIDKPAFVEQVSRLGLRVIEITRDDLLKTSISQIRRGELAEQAKNATGKAVQNLVDGLDRPPPSTINPAELLRQLRRDDTARNDAKLVAGLASSPRLTLTYETLLRDRHAALDRVADFLGVEIAERDDFRPRKNTPDDLAEAVANLDEVREALLDSDYAGLIET